jgi:hemerythrin
VAQIYKRKEGKMIIKWDQSYELNIPVIDTQHKQLFALLNELDENLRRGVKVSTIADVLTRTQQYVVRHFSLEEKYMKDSKYPGLDAQIAAHRYFTNRSTTIVEEFKRSGLTPSVVQSLKQELSEWIKNHIMVLDVAFGKYYSNSKSK